MKTRIHEVFESIPDDMVLHPKNIADLLGVDVETVRRWCRDGKLENYSFGGKYVIMGDDFKGFMRKAKSRTKAEKELLGNE